MRTNAGKPARGRGASAGWHAVTFVILLAFTLQSFVTQTHLHVMSQPRGAQTIVDAPHHGKTPLDESPATCPFCQATIHAGAFFAPASPHLVLPAWLAGFTIIAVTCDAVRRAFAHAWYSRAPPHFAI